MDAQDAKRIRVMRVIARMNVGGPAVQVSGLMRGINSGEFDQRLFTGRCTSDEEDYLETVATDISAYRVEGLGRSFNFINDIKAFMMLVLAIRGFKPHIIHSHTAKAGVLARIASLVSLHPSIRVHTFHGHLLHGYFGNVKKFLVVTIEKTLGLITHQLLAVGKQVRQDLLDVGVGSEKKFGVMPPGLDLRNLPSRESASTVMGLDSSSLKCAFIGRLTQIKRPDRFLEVVAEVSKRGVEIEFLVAGSGELLGICKDKVNYEQLPVMFLGWQTNIEQVLAAVDMVILTSDNEGTPLSLIQAGMAGLPAISTKVGSVPEILIENLTGLITSMNIIEIADAIELLASDAKLRIDMGARAKKFTLTNFGSRRLVDDHETLYRKLLASQPRSAPTIQA